MNPRPAAARIAWWSWRIHFRRHPETPRSNHEREKEAHGRRSVQVEVEVPGTPEEVWAAIATGPGISSWFVPTEFEERDGKPVAVTCNFGPGMESRSAVTTWDPPRMFAAHWRGLGWLAANGNRVERRSTRGRRVPRPRCA